MFEEYAFAGEERRKYNRLKPTPNKKSRRLPGLNAINFFF